MARVAESPRTLVIGTGYAGQRHADALKELGVVFAGPISARDAARDVALIRDSPAQVVHVCASNDLHAPLVSAALYGRKDVVCEKPLATDVPTAEALAERATRAGRTAVLGYNYRFHPMIVELTARIADDQLGALHDVRGSFLQDWLLLPADVNWRIDPARGGASRVIADIGAHWVDLAEVVTGQKVVGVVAHVGRLHQRATEDHAGLLMRFDRGLVGTCVLSQAAPGHRNDLELSVDGTKSSATWRHERPGELWMGMRDASDLIRRDGPFVSAVARRLAQRRPDPNEARRNLLAAVYARLDGDPSPPIAPIPTFADGVRHLRFAAAALESARRRAWVDLA
jgi:predicted dehydrogenase